MVKTAARLLRITTRSRLIVQSGAIVVEMRLRCSADCPHKVNRGDKAEDDVLHKGRQSKTERIEVTQPQRKCCSGENGSWQSAAERGEALG